MRIYEDPNLHGENKNPTDGAHMANSCGSIVSDLDQRQSLSLSLSLEFIGRSAYTNVITYTDVLKVKLD